MLSASAAHAVCSHLRSGKISCLQVCLLGLQVFSSPWQSVDFVNILSFAFGETAEFAGFWAAHCPFSFRENPADFRARKPQGSVFALGKGISQGKNPSVPAVHEVTLPVFQTVKTRRRGRLWRERVSFPRTQLVKKVFLTSLQTGKQVPCRYHLLQFLLRGMGFSGAKIAPSPPYTRRFCRLSKLSKSVGLRRLENLKGFRPAAGDDYSAKGFRPPRALRWFFATKALAWKVDFRKAIAMPGAAPACVDSRGRQRRLP